MGVVAPGEKNMAITTKAKIVGYEHNVGYKISANGDAVVITF